MNVFKTRVSCICRVLGLSLFKHARFSCMYWGDRRLGISMVWWAGAAGPERGETLAGRDRYRLGCGSWVWAWACAAARNHCAVPQGCGKSLTTVVVQLLGHIWLFVTPWAAACQTSLSFSISWSLLKLMSIESVMSSNYLILCCPLLFLPSIFPKIRVFFNGSKSIDCNIIKKKINQLKISKYNFFLKYRLPSHSKLCFSILIDPK